MFKRLLSLFLAGSLLLAGNVTALADTQDVSGNRDATVNVTANINDTYSVRIPKSIEIGDSKTADYEVVVSGEISSSKVLTVVPDSEFVLTRDGNESDNVTATITQDKTEWASNEFDTVGSGVIDASSLSSGSWSGSFDFHIGMEDFIDTAIDLDENGVANDGEVMLASGQEGNVQLMHNGVDVTSQASYSSDNPNITVDEGKIDTSNASAGEIANITATYTPVATSSLDDGEVLACAGRSYTSSASNASEGETEATSSDALVAVFTVKVIGLEFEVDSVQVVQGQSVVVEASILPEGTDGTINYKITGLEMTVEDNVAVISTTEDTVTGNYVLIAEFNRCTETLNIQVVGADEHTHDYSEEVTTESGCETPGVKTFTCECGDTYTEEIPAGHDYVNDVCSRCGSVAEGHTHIYDQGVVTTEPGCETVGIKTYTCVCKHSYTEEVEAVGHSYVNGVCSVCGGEDPNYVVPLPSEPGLYDDKGNLLCSWDESGIDVQSHYEGVTDDDSSPRYILKNVYPSTSIVVLPEGIKTIGHESFKGCSNLNSVVLPNSVTFIGRSAFYNCTSLVNMNIPYSLVTLCEYSLDCTKLEEIVIPSSTTDIRGTLQIPTLRSIVVEEGNSVYDSRDNCNAIIKTESNILIQGCISTIIPSSVVSIGSRAFCRSNIASISIPNSVTSIGVGAFSDCSNLTTITLSSSLTEINQAAFQYTKITEVVMPSSVRSICMYVFRGCDNLNSVIFKDTTTWYTGSSSGLTTNKLSSSDLANASKAAEYLRSTYTSKYWTKQ